MGKDQIMGKVVCISVYMSFVCALIYNNYVYIWLMYYVYVYIRIAYRYHAHINHMTIYAFCFSIILYYTMTLFCIFRPLIQPCIRRWTRRMSPRRTARGRWRPTWQMVMAGYTNRRGRPRKLHWPLKRWTRREVTGAASWTSCSLVWATP